MTTGSFTRRDTLKFAALLGLAPTMMPLAARAEGDTLLLSVDLISTLDPARSRSSGGNLSVLSQLASSLTKITSDGTLVGELAESWDVVSATEFHFHLNPNAKFENGKALDAAVVVWNFERMANPDVKATANTGFGAIESVEAADAHTVVIKTKAPWLELPRRLSWMFMLEPEWTAEHNPQVEVLASGPYRLVSYDPGGDLVMEPNPSYFGEAPAIPNVTYRGIGSAATRISGIRGGEIDGTLRIDPIDLAQLDSLDDYTVGAKEGQRYCVMKFHFGREPLKDIRVRQAINYAIDKETITKAIFRGYVGAGTTQVLNPQTPGFDTEMTPWPYDPAKAKELLAEAGFANGLELKLNTTTESSFQSVSPITQVITAQLAEVGIKLNVELLPQSAFLALRTQPENAPDLTYAGYVSQSNSATELFGQYSSKGPYGWGDYPPAFDAAIATASQATGEEEQVELIKAASKAMMDDVLVVFLWLQPQTFAVAKALDWTPRTDDWIKASEMTWKNA